MAFRDDHDAALHRVEALERELAATREKLAVAERTAAASQDKVSNEEAKPRKRRGDQDRRRSVGAMAFCLVVGPLLGGYIVCTSLDTAADLEGGARTFAIDWRPAKGGDYPIIEVDGKRYECDQAGRSNFNSQPVLYDPLDPGNCRLEAEIGELTGREKIHLVFGLFLIISMLYVGFVRRRA